MLKGISPRSKGLILIFILVIFALLLISSAQPAIAQGGGSGGSGGEGSGGEGSGGGSGGEGSGGEAGSSGDVPQGGGDQNQVQDEGETRGQEQSGEGNQKQEQSGGGGGSGGGNNDGDGESNAWRHQFRNQINQSIENGSLVMEATFQIRNRQMIQENNHYQLGMELELEEATQKRLRVRVRAEYKEGKLVVLNVGHNVLDCGESGQCNLYFDGNMMQLGTLGEVIGENGSNPKYTAAFGEGGAQFLVYLPYFSQHTIEIESLMELTQKELFSGTNLIVASIGILILMGLSFHIYRIGKSRK